MLTSPGKSGSEPPSVLEAQAGHLSKRMSDHYKHISEKAARKASEALSRVKAEQRAEARAKMREQASVDSDSVAADAIPTNVASFQAAVVHCLIGWSGRGDLNARPPAPKADSGLARKGPIFSSFYFNEMRPTC